MEVCHSTALDSGAAVPIYRAEYVNAHNGRVYVGYSYFGQAEAEKAAKRKSEAADLRRVHYGDC
jgi:hypothetical protein